MCFEDVMAQLNRLLPVQLVLQPREPEGQKGVPTPVETEKHFQYLRLSHQVITFCYLWSWWNRF